ncbi:MAG: hypothetical protein WCG25_07230 [bacterium]
MYACQITKITGQLCKRFFRNFTLLSIHLILHLHLVACNQYFSSTFIIVHGSINHEILFQKVGA